MTEQEIRQIVNTQRAYFYTGATLPLASRIKALEKLQACIREKRTSSAKPSARTWAKAALKATCAKQDWC